MHKVLTPYGMRKADSLNKAQVRKVANLVVWKSKKQSGLDEFEKQLLSEYPALKRPSQQKRVIERADAIVEREKAFQTLTSSCLSASTNFCF